MSSPGMETYHAKQQTMQNDDIDAETSNRMMAPLYMPPLKE